MQETYITHIRITEFSTHASTPPPPQARSPEVEKQRIIIVAVRKSGRVRMHKSKENSNGTFSIGKTWNLDDLTRIQSFSSPTVDPSLKQAAGETGFVITVQKPYFWDAQTEKEKKFFIATLVKIYGKYTNGKTPDLTGFDPRELDQVLGRRPPPPRPPPGESMGQRNVSGSSAANVPSIPSVPSVPNVPPQPVPPQPTQLASSPMRPGPLPTNKSSPAGSFDSTRSQQAALRRLGASDKSQDSVPASLSPGRSDDAASLPPRSRGGITGPGALGRFGESSPEPAPPVAAPVTAERPPERKRPPIEAMKPPPAQFADKDLVPAPLMSPGKKKDPVLPPPRSTNRMSPGQNSMAQASDSGSLRDRAISQNESLRAKSSSTSLKNTGPTPFSRASPLNEPPLPQQKSTPPEPEDSRPGLGPMMKQKKPAPEPPPKVPLDAPSDVQEPKDDTRPGLGPMRRQRNVTPDFIAASVGNEDDDPRPGLGPMIKSKKSIPELAPSPPPEESEEARPGLGPMIKNKTSITDLSSPPSPEESQDSRPGLGPMIKGKKSKGELAGSMWKAAAAAGAFQPRRGGAGERLRMARNKSEDGPDGITDVVPAPPRPPSSDAKAAGTPEPPEPEEKNGVLPEVKVTVPQTSRPASRQTAEKNLPPEPSPAQDEQPPQEEERRAVATGNDIKYLATLGIDPAQAPTFLDNPKSVQLREWMDVAGFVPGEQMRACTWDHMKTDLDRELDKAQAGGWLSRFREDDERIDAIKGGIDHVILECDQLDDLLTLYSAGLGVSAYVCLCIATWSY